MKRLIFIMLVGWGCGVNAQQAMPSSKAVLEKAYREAQAQNKNIFLIFHASWCYWCHKMDTAMSDPVCSKLFMDHYIIVHLDVLEQPDKKSLENEGSQEVMKKYDPTGNGGVPVWAILDKKGNLLADSFMKPGENTGCPSKKEEIAYFLTVLHKTSPLLPGQLAVVEKRFKQIEPAHY